VTTDEIRTILEQGVTVFARRPAQGDTELELITVTGVARGFATGTSTASRKTRWSLAYIVTVEAASAKIEAKSREHRRARRARRESEQLQQRVYDLLEHVELTSHQAEQLTGPSSDSTAHLSLSLLDLRKLVVVLSGLVEGER
jgi:hypothetical protein